MAADTSMDGFDETADAYFRRLAASSIPIDYRIPSDSEQSKSKALEERVLNLEIFQREVWSVIETLRERVENVTPSAINLQGIVATPHSEGTDKDDRDQWQNGLKQLQSEMEKQARITEALSISTTKELDRRMEEFQKALDSQRPSDGAADKGAGREFLNQEGEDEDIVKYKLAPSTWECVCVSFAHTVDIPSSVQAVFLLCLTAIVQSFFVGVVYFSLSQPTFTEDMENAYKEFRVTVLHNDHYTDNVNHKSLVQRLCDRSMSLEVANSQASTLGDIDGYLGTGESSFEVLFSGPLMCSLSLGCWALTVFAEVRQIMNLVESLLRLPVEHETRIIYFQMGYRIESITVSRLGCMLAISLIRFSLCAALLFEGGKFLAVEASVPDLLLNTVALEFVLHIDQLVFKCLARDSNKRVIEKLIPLKFRVPREVLGLDPKTLVYVLLTSGYIASFFIAVVHPLMDSMKMIEEALCSRNKAFTFVEDAFGFFYIDTLSPVTNTAFKKIPRETIGKAITLSTAELESPLSLPFAQNPTIVGYSLEELVTLDRGTMVDHYNMNCVDLLPSSQHSMFDYSEYAVLYFGAHVKSCGDIASACDVHDQRGTIARWLCAVTCTCNIPNSTTRSIYSRDGCPSACRETHKYKEILMTATCADNTPTQLGSSAFWQASLRYLTAAKVTAFVGNALKDHGCHALSPAFSGFSKQQKEDLCSATGVEALSVRPLAFACPVACGCNSSVDIAIAKTKLATCPGTCHFSLKLF